ncbi:MAG TPA: hypothetical protein VNI77_01835 [Nitrososphaera sp.]|nr:hypothetical protein [Nitrososphaera sp.]
MYCAICGKELGRHKYKPDKDWGVEGLLCAGCHIEKTKEFMLKEEGTSETCGMCGKELGDIANKPKWQWDMEPGTLLCDNCYRKKDEDYNKKRNFCAICDGKLGMFYYHPKPAWRIDGNLCRKCWDSRNRQRGD